MYIVNHFLDDLVAPGIKVPDRLRAPRTNSKASIRKQLKTCEDLYWGTLPNFVLMDFVDQGDWNRGNLVTEIINAACNPLKKVAVDC